MMRAIIAILVILLQSTAAYAACTKFCTMDGERIRHYDSTWKELKSFYGRYMPQNIRIRYEEGQKGGYFDATNRIVTVGMAPISLLIPHESSHVILYKMTNGKSNTDEYRFIDEGWASIVGARFTGYHYKKSALRTAKKELEKGNVNFDTVQNWTEYFGNWKTTKRKGVKRNYDAYDVGASFVYYLVDEYGEKKYKKFLVALGKEPGLNTALLKIYDKPMDQIQSDWQYYVQQYEI